MHAIQKTVGELLERGGVTPVAPSAPVSDAVRLMRESGAAGVLVMEGEGEGGRLVGIFTERDLLYKVAAIGLPIDTPVRQVMTPEPVTLDPDDCVTWAINRLAFHGFSHLPIVNEYGTTVGLLGVRDVLHHLSEVFADLEAPDSYADSIDTGGG